MSKSGAHAVCAVCGTALATAYSNGLVRFAYNTVRSYVPKTESLWLECRCGQMQRYSLKDRSRVALIATEAQAEPKAAGPTERAA